MISDGFRFVTEGDELEHRSWTTRINSDGRTETQVYLGRVSRFAGGPPGVVDEIRLNVTEADARRIIAGRVRVIVEIEP